MCVFNLKKKRRSFVVILNNRRLRKEKLNYNALLMFFGMLQQCAPCFDNSSERERVRARRRIVKRRGAGAGALDAGASFLMRRARLALAQGAPPLNNCCACSTKAMRKHKRLELSKRHASPPAAQ